MNESGFWHMNGSVIGDDGRGQNHRYKISEMLLMSAIVTSFSLYSFSHTV